jgi:hypothetical protein
MRYTILSLFAILTLTAPHHALAQAVERAESQLRDSAVGGPELSGAPAARATPQESGYLGIKADNHGSGAGIRIVEIVERSPAAAAGLEAGDVINAVHGKPVRTVDDFAALVGRMSVGTHVVFDIERSGQQQSIEVVLGRKQSTAAVPQMRLGPQAPRAEVVGASPISTAPISTAARSTDRPAPLGLRVEAIDDSARRSQNLPADAGVLVTRVTKNSAAAKAGISVGTVLLAIDGASVPTPDEAAAALSRARVGQPLAFVMNEGGRQVARRVTPESVPASPPPMPRDIETSTARDDSAPAAGSGRRTARPMATINSEINDARSTIRRLQARVAELEGELEALQDKAEKRRDDILGTEEAIRQAAPKSKTLVVPVEP